MTMKISRKDLERLSKDELLAIAREADKITESNKERTLESYWETAHKAQIDFCKAAATHRIRYFVGGNRCLIDSTLLSTVDGERAIADILKPTQYVSFDQVQSQFRLSLGSAPFPKAKENLYRVVHEQGEFVGSGNHLVFCSDRVYRPLASLCVDRDALFSPDQTISSFLPQTNSAPYQKASLSDDRRLTQKPSSFLDDYVAYNHQCGQPPRLDSKFFEEHIQSQSDALIAFQLLDQKHIDHKDALAELLLKYIHHGRMIDLIENAYSSRHLVDQSVYELLSKTFSEAFEHTSHQSPLNQQFLERFSIHRNNDGSAQLDKEGLDFSCTRKLPIGFSISKIDFIEKLPRSDWVWDLSVPGDNNYLAAGVVHHNSGKSTAGFIEDTLLATGKHPYLKNWKTPCKGLVVVQDFENAAKNVLEPKFMEWCPKGDIVKVEKNQAGAWRKIFFKNGSTIEVLSHDQDVKVFEGSDYDFAHFDEPPPKKIYNAVWRGLTDRGGIMFVTATPLASPWMYNEFLRAKEGDPLRWFTFVDMKENAKNLGGGDLELGLKRINEFASMLDKDEKESRLHGQFAQVRGLIFKAFDKKHHLINPFPVPGQWPIWESIDPHPHKPWGISWIAVAPAGQKILIRSSLLEGTIEDIAAAILYERTQLPMKEGHRPRIVRCLIDNSSSVPTWQKSNTDPTIDRISVREELENYIGPRSGGPCVTVAPKNVAQKIDLFKTWLHISNGVSTFYAFNIPENERFIFEIENYVWDSFRGAGLKDKPKKEDDDILDTILQVALSLPKQEIEEDCRPYKAMESKSWRVK